MTSGYDTAKQENSQKLLRMEKGRTKRTHTSRHSGLRQQARDEVWPRGPAGEVTQQGLPVSQHLESRSRSRRQTPERLDSL